MLHLLKHHNVHESNLIIISIGHLCVFYIVCNLIIISIGHLYVFYIVYNIKNAQMAYTNNY